jgi:hypothetical protein
LEKILQLPFSQYSFGGGSSSCTAISLYVMADLLQSLVLGSEYDNVERLSDVVVNSIQIYNSFSSNENKHFAVDELLSIFPETIKQIGNSFEGLLTERNAFENLFANVRNIAENNKYIGVIITKPPETVCVILPPKNSSGTNLFLMFDSHSRPQFQLENSSLLTAKLLDCMIQKLERIFTPLPIDSDEDFGAAENLAQMMYNMFEATVFQLKD